MEETTGVWRKVVIRIATELNEVLSGCGFCDDKEHDVSILSVTVIVAVVAEQKLMVFATELNEVLSGCGFCDDKEHDVSILSVTVIVAVVVEQ